MFVLFVLKGGQPPIVTVSSPPVLWCSLQHAFEKTRTSTEMTRSSASNRLHLVFKIETNMEMEMLNSVAHGVRNNLHPPHDRRYLCFFLTKHLLQLTSKNICFTHDCFCGINCSMLFCLSSSPKSCLKHCSAKASVVHISDTQSQ